ncbi:MAG TPA: phosphotransferase, partial [Ktedonobacterales bacterium]|nr:phosphotransferase [Ktedonobacterales bacterium]
ERYVLRISRPGKHTLEEVRSEMAWLSALRRDTALVVPEPVATRDGALAQMFATEGVPEARICVLLRWVEGRFLNARLAPQHLHRVGAFTARLHDHAAAFAPPAGFTRGRVARVDAAWETVTLQRVAAARPRGDVALMRATIQQIRATLDSLSQDPAVYGLLHADLHQENYLFHRPEVRAIDFDDCAFGHHLYDLSVTLSEVEHHANFAALRAALLSGYRAVRPLPDGHDMALPALIARRRIDLIMWLIDSREHPGFHDRWGPDVTEELRRLRAFANR